MSFDLTQFRDLIIRVTTAQELCSETATNLILGTCAVESNFGTYLRQINGPALGIFQIEPATETDIWENYLYLGRSKQQEVIYKITGVKSYNNAGAMEFNIAYGICMCRLHYRRIVEPFPKANNIKALSQYWKKYYNTFRGKGIAEQFKMAYKKYICSI